MGIPIDDETHYFWGVENPSQFLLLIRCTIYYPLTLASFMEQLYITKIQKMCEIGGMGHDVHEDQDHVNQNLADDNRGQTTPPPLLLSTRGRGVFEFPLFCNGRLSVSPKVKKASLPRLGYDSSYDYGLN